MLKNSNKKGHYVNGSKLHQLGWYGDLFRTKAVLNTFPVDNIDIKEIIGLYECFLLARILFDANGLPNNGGDGKSNLVHAVTNSIDGASIHPWRGKLNVSVIVAIGTIFTFLYQLSSKASNIICIKSHCSQCSYSELFWFVSSRIQTEYG